MNYAERMGAQTARIYAYFSLGLANVLNGAWHDALEVLGTALTIGREGSVIVQGREHALSESAETIRERPHFGVLLKLVTHGP